MATGLPFECECGMMFVFTEPQRLGDPHLTVTCPFCAKRSLAFNLYERTILSAKHLGVWAIMSDLMEAGHAIIDVGKTHHVDLSLPFDEIYSDSVRFEPMAGNLAAGTIAVNVTNQGFDIGSWFAPGLGSGATQVDLRWYAFGRSDAFKPSVWRQYLHMALVRRQRGESTLQLVLAMIAWESWMNWTMLDHLESKAVTEQNQRDIRQRIKQAPFEEKMNFTADGLPEHVRQRFNQQPCRGRLQAGKNFRNDIVHGWVEEATPERADETLSAVLRGLYLTGSHLMQPIHTLAEGRG